MRLNQYIWTVVFTNFQSEKKPQLKLCLGLEFYPEVTTVALARVTRWFVRLRGPIWADLGSTRRHFGSPDQNSMPFWLTTGAHWADLSPIYSFGIHMVQVCILFNFIMLMSVHVDCPRVYATLLYVLINIVWTCPHVHVEPDEQPGPVRTISVP